MVRRETKSKARTVVLTALTIVAGVVITFYLIDMKSLNELLDLIFGKGRP